MPGAAVKKRGVRSNPDRIVIGKFAQSMIIILLMLSNVLLFFKTIAVPICQIVNIHTFYP